ncbi:MAG TPA: SPOR domain-containing protein [Ignavibacteria bacterium]|nr:SPOR domain-containing protein [Ignavibacteria bacterium]
MKKEELVNIIQTETGISKIEASDFVDNLFSIIKSGFKKGKRLNIPEFGKFVLVSKKGEDGKLIKSISFSPVKKFSNDVNLNFNNLKPIPVALLRDQADIDSDLYDFELDDDEILLKDNDDDTEKEIKTEIADSIKSDDKIAVTDEIESEVSSHLSNILADKIEKPDESKEDFGNVIEEKRKSFFHSERYLKGKQITENEELTISDKIISDSFSDEIKIETDTKTDDTSKNESQDIVPKETDETSETELIKRLSELDNNFSKLQSQIEDSVTSEIEKTDAEKINQAETKEKPTDELFSGINISQIQDEINAKLKETFDPPEKQEKIEPIKEIPEVKQPEKIEPEIFKDEIKDEIKEEAKSFIDVFEDKDKIIPVVDSEKISDDEIKIPDIDFQKIFSENASETNEVNKDDNETFDGSDILIPDDIKQLHNEIEEEKPKTDKSFLSDEDDFNFIKNYSDIFENKSEDEIKETNLTDGEISDLPPVYTRPPEEEKESNKIFSLSVVLVIVITILVFATTYFLLSSDIFSPKRLPLLTDSINVQTPQQTNIDTINQTNQAGDTAKIKIIGGDTFKITDTEKQTTIETNKDTIKPIETTQTQNNTPPNQQIQQNTTNPESQYRILNAGEEEQINDPANSVVYVRTTEGVYIQTGSYKSKTDADKKAATLQKSGLNIIVKEANLGEKGIWFRVRAGKFSTVEEAKTNVNKLKK